MSLDANLDGGGERVGKCLGGEMGDGVCDIKGVWTAI